MKKRIFKKLPRRDGVALIIVLAMLTILLALALSLSATTRAERSVVKVHTEMTNSRQLVHAAINRALLDIQLQGNSFVPAKAHTPGGWDDGGGGTRVVNSFPGRRMFYVNTTSGGTPSTVDFVPQVGFSNDRLTDLDMRLLLSPESRQFFTYDQRTVDAINHIQATSNVWIGLRMFGEPRTNTQFTYIAENVSDGIDLNFAFADPPVSGGRLPRNYGQTPLEINWLPMWNVLGLASGGNDPNEGYGVEDTIYNFVSSMGRIDTIREINEYMPVAMGFGPSDREKLAAFNTFSYNPELNYQLINNTIIAKANISEGKAKWPADAVIKTAFLDSRVFSSKPEEFTVAEADTLVACLKDYVDDDMWPTDITLGSIEPVPMVNEISASAGLENVTQAVDKFNYEVNGNYAVELWWPFVEEDPMGRAFEFKADVEVTVEVTGTDENGGNVTDIKTETKNVSMNSIKGELAQPFTVITGSVPVMVESTVVLNPSSNKLEKIKVTTKYTNIKVLQGGADSDAVANGIQFEWEQSFAGLSFPIPVSDRKFEAKGREVVDPRFNYAMAEWKNTPDGEASIDDSLPIKQQVNFLTRRAWASDANLDPNIQPGLDENTPAVFPRHASQMHARNGALSTVGELGFLPYRDWRTIRLLAKGDEIYHRLGEYFLVTNDNPVARFIVEEQLDNPRGKVNVNGNPLALASAFYDLPIELYPGQVAPAPVHFAADDWNKAVLFGQFLAGGRPDNGAGAFASEWDLGSVTLYRPAIFNNPLIVPANLSEFEIESFFRNTMGLLTTRNNVFTVMVMVQSLSKLDAPTSTIRAVATVWRDGMPTEGYVQDGGAQRGIHPWFIQNITYLTDYENN
jgi:hypothetical protein